MKTKKFIAAGILAVSLLGLQSCNKAKEAVNAAKEAANEASGKEKIDYKLFSDPAQTKKWYDAVVEKLGKNTKVTDEVRFIITKNSDKVVKTDDDSDDLSLSIVYQDNVDKRRVQQINYSSSFGWREPQTMEIDVIGVNPEEFRLEDELFDFKEVTLETLKKVIDDAWKKHKDDEAFEYQYVNDITIKQNEIEVSIKGKLKSNAQEKSNYYKTDFKGNAR
jgi:hypothetical protein